MSSSNSDRTIDLVIRATDLSSQPIKQVTDQVKALITVLEGQVKASQSGAASAYDLTKAMQDLGKAQDILIKQKAALADLPRAEARVDATAARVDIARGARDSFAAGLPDESERTAKQNTQLNTLNNRLQAAQTAATKAGDAYDRAAARLERMGVNVLETDRAQRQLSASMLDVANAMARGNQADGEFISNKQRAARYVADLTELVKEYDAGLERSAQIERDATAERLAGLKREEEALAASVKAEDAAARARENARLKAADERMAFENQNKHNVREFDYNKTFQEAAAASALAAEEQRVAEKAAAEAKKLYDKEAIESARRAHDYKLSLIAAETAAEKAREAEIARATQARIDHANASQHNVREFDLNRVFEQAAAEAKAASDAEKAAFQAAADARKLADAEMTRSAKEKAEAVIAAGKAEDAADKAFAEARRTEAAEQRARLAKAEEEMRFFNESQRRVREFEISKIFELAAAEKKADTDRIANAKLTADEATKIAKQAADEQIRIAREAAEQQNKVFDEIRKFQQIAREAASRASATYAQAQATGAQAGNLGAGPATQAVQASLAAIPSRHGGGEITDADAAIDKLNITLQKGKVFASTYVKSMEEVYSVQKKLSGDASLIDAFTKQADAAKKADAAMLAAGKAFRDAATATPSLTVSQEHLNLELRRTEAEFNKAAAAVGRETGQLNKLRAELVAAGIDENNLAAATARLTASADRLTKAQEGISKKEFGFLGLRPYELKNLEYQIGDIYTQLSLGQGLTRTFLSQSDQIFQLFDFSMRSLIKYIPIAAAAAAGIYVVYEALDRYLDQLKAVRNFTARLAANVDGPTYNSRNLVETQKAVERFGVSFEDAGKAVEEFVKLGIAPERMKDFAKISQNMADTYGTKFADNIKEVTAAFTGGYDAIKKLDEAYNFLTLAQREHIRDLMDQGHAEEARAYALDAYIAKQNEGAALSRSSWQVEVRELTNAWHAFLDALTNGQAMQTVITQLTEMLRLTVLLTRRWSGEISAQTFTKQFLRLASGEAALGPKEEQLSELESKRSKLKEDISLFGILGTRTPAEIEAMQRQLAAIETQISALKGSAGVEALTTQLDFLEKRRDELIRRGVTATEPRVQVPTTSNAGVPAAFGEMRDRVAAQVGIDPEAFARLQRSEGVYKDGKWQDSPTGAKGPAQTIQSTFDAMKAKYKDITGDIHDELSNLLAGAYYFKEKLVGASGDIKKATEAYHDGSALPGGASKDARIQADKVSAGYTGVALQPNYLNEIDAQILKIKNSMAMLPAAVLETNRSLGETGRIVTDNAALLEKANADFADNQRRINAAARDRNLDFAQTRIHDAEAIVEMTKRLNNEAADKIKGPQSEDVKKEIAEAIRFETERRAEALDKRIKAEEAKQAADLQTALNNLATIQARIDGMDKTNAAARRRAVDEQYQKDFDQLDKFQKDQAEKAKKEGTTPSNTIGGEPIEAFRARLLAAREALKDQVTAEADVAAVTKIIEERKTALEAITKDFKSGLITAAVMFERMAAAADKFAPKIRQAADTARGDLVRQGGAKPSAAVSEGIGKIDAIRADDREEQLRGLGLAFEAADKLNKAHNDTIRAQAILVADGLTTTRDGEQKIAEAYAATKGESDKLIESLRGQIEHLHEIGVLVGPAYDLWIAKLGEVVAQNQYVSKETRDLFKGIESSFESRGSAAFETVAKSLASLANGTAKLKDVFASVGQAFGNFAAGMLMDIAKIILRTELLALAQKLIGSPANAATGAAASGLMSLFTTAAAVAHDGGTVGGSGVVRQINPAAFHAAVRFHTGGMVGLSADEVPAILQRGEQVISKSGVRAAANGNIPPKSQSIRNVLVVGDQEVAGAMASAHGEEVVMNHLKRNMPTVRKWL